MTGDKMNLIPILVVKGADKALELYRKAFGATETYPPMKGPGGEIMHSSLTIGGNEIFVAEENAARGTVAGQNLGFYLRVPDVDAAMKLAVNAGMTELQKAEDMFWGDRMGTVKDAFGIKWMLATHVRDVSPEEIAQAMKK